VLVCPGGLEMGPGPAVALAFPAAAVFWAVARSGVKPETPSVNPVANASGG